MSANWVCDRHDAQATSRTDNYPLSSSHSITWQTTTNAYAGRSPVLYGNMIYYLGGDEGGSISCVSTTDGSTVWEFDFGGHGTVDSPPIVADGRCYFGTHSALLCLNATTGTRLWSASVGSTDIYSTARAL